MKTLVVEDDFACRRLMQVILSKYGECSVAVNGKEAVNALREALDNNDPYDLICLDIMMPEMDGRETLKAIRQIESEHGILGLDGVKIIMTTAMNNRREILNAFQSGCEAYLVKPIVPEKLLAEIDRLGVCHQ